MVLNQTRKKVPRKFSEKWFQMLTRELQVKKKHQKYLEQSVNVVFVDKTTMRRMNREFRKKDYVTDVLSFHSDEEGLLGEIVISMDKIREQAKEHEMTVPEELAYMLLHGVLHLMGYDHEKSSVEAKKMFQLQDEVFEKLRVKIEKL